MNKIECGTAQLHFEVGNDGIARAHWSGLVLPGNAGELSGRLLKAACEAGARAIIGDLSRTLLALPPVNPAYYRWVPVELRAVPISFVISAEQTPIYLDLPQAAAEAHMLRRAVRSAEEGESWLSEQVRAITSNGAWWKLRQTPALELGGVTPG